MGNGQYSPFKCFNISRIRQSRWSKWIRIRLEPQKNWDVNKPQELEKVLNVYDKIAKKYKTSIADVIVIGGAVGIEMASGTICKCNNW